MLMFQEYARKLAEVYDQMSDDPDLGGYIADLYGEMFVSIESVQFFCEGMAEISENFSGRNVSGWRQWYSAAASALSLITRNSLFTWKIIRKLLALSS